LKQQLVQFCSQFSVDNDNHTNVRQSVLCRFVSSSKDLTVMRQIPIVLSVTFLVHAIWKDSTYLENIGNFNNNGILIADAVNELFDIFYHNNKTLKRNMKLFWLRNAIFVIQQNIKCPTVNGTRKSLKNCSNLVAFLDYFVQIADDCYLGDLQDMNIYDNIRAEYVKISAINMDMGMGLGRFQTRKASQEEQLLET
jgi:hypothetical protein